MRLVNSWHSFSQSLFVESLCHIIGLSTNRIRLVVSLLAIIIMITIVSIMSDGEKTLSKTYEYLCPLLLLLDLVCKKRFFWWQRYCCYNLPDPWQPEGKGLIRLANQISLTYLALPN